MSSCNKYVVLPFLFLLLLVCEGNLPQSLNLLFRRERLNTNTVVTDLQTSCQSRVYYKIVALESELRSYLQHLLKTINIKMIIVNDNKIEA